MTQFDFEPPSVADVASHIRSRTKDSNGREQGTFTDDTQPTGEQAKQAIDNQMKLLRGRVASVDEGCAELAQVAVALGAAAEIELSYFSEQIRTDRSAYNSLVQRGIDALEGLVMCVSGELPGETAGNFGTLQVASGVVDDYYAGRFGYGYLPPKPPA